MRRCVWKIDGKECGKATSGSTNAYCNEHKRLYEKNRKVNPAPRTRACNLVHERRIREKAREVGTQVAAKNLIAISESGNFVKWEWEDKLKLLTSKMTAAKLFKTLQDDDSEDDDVRDTKYTQHIDPRSGREYYFDKDTRQWDRQSQRQHTAASYGAYQQKQKQSRHCYRCPESAEESVDYPQRSN